MVELETKIKSPFPGLRPFETHERRIFYGRDRPIDVLLEKLRNARFVAVVGTSGSGKSSLVRAGLLPALQGGFLVKAGSSWRIALFRPVNNPIGNLAQSLCEAKLFLDGESQTADPRAAIEETLRRSSLGLIEVVRRSKMSSYDNLLIVVDQFEELYRFESNRDSQHTKEEASAFVKLLLEAAQQTELPIYMVLTMRSDYLGESAQFWGLPEAINNGQLLIPRMDEDERREAISGPLSLFNVKISPPLVNRLLNDARDDPNRLPILQHALMRTWDYWLKHPRDSRTIDIDDYDNAEVGGMDKALSLHADEAYKELNEAQQVIAEKMFKRLTEKGAGSREGRLPATLGEITEIVQADEADVVTVIEAFRQEGRSFLMPPVPKALTTDTLIDISHESLIRGWDRLDKWVEEEADSAKIYSRLVDDALRYPQKTGLLTDPELQLTLDWREKQHPNKVWAKRYSPDYMVAMDYLDKSKDEHDRAEAQKERQRRKSLVYVSATAIILLILLVITSVALGIARRESANAKKERQAAEKARETAQQSFQMAEDERQKTEKAREIAQQAYQTAEEERQKAEASSILADERAIEAERQRIQAVAARNQAQQQAKRGNLLEQGISLALNGETAKAIDQYEALRPIYLKGNDPSKQVLPDILIGNTILRSDDMDSEDSLRYFKRVLDIVQKNSGLKIDPQTFIYISDALKKNSSAFGIESSDVIPFYKQAIRMLRDDKDAKLKAETLGKLGDYYLELSTPDEAKTAYDEADRISEKSGNPVTRGDTLRKLANYYRYTRNIDQAVDYYNRAIKAYGANGSPGTDALYGTGLALEAIGKIYEGTGKKQEAIKQYQQAVDLYRKASKDYKARNRATLLLRRIEQLNKPEKTGP
jgi:tetratricopeptide (TPR) repeat protein